MKRILQSAPMRAALAWAAARYVTMVSRTVRWRFEGEEFLAEMAGEAPVIVAFWHEALPSMPVFWRRARRLGMRRPAVVLASQHRDGQLIGRAVQSMGIGLVSGSSSRGGAGALRALAKALSAGANVGLTPDGPRGPRRVCAPGIAQLAAMSGARVLPCGAMFSHARVLRSWDAMRIPLPFGRGALVCGAPIAVAHADIDAGLAAITTALNMALHRAGKLL